MVACWAAGQPAQPAEGACMRPSPTHVRHHGIPVAAGPHNAKPAAPQTPRVRYSALHHLPKNANGDTSPRHLPGGPMPPFATHAVVNQVAPLEDYSLYETDLVLRQAVQREGAAAYESTLREHGAWLGRASTLAAGERANRCLPRWLGYDPSGHRIDQVEFDPAWHALMSGIVARGLHSHAWLQPAPGAQATRAAAYLMQGQVEAGTLCPTTMTYAAVPLLQQEPAGVIDFAQHWLPALASHDYDAADAPLPGKRSALIGMGLTEKQGGSDLRAITTRAEPVAQGGRGAAYLLTGHKWFFSVPHADAHLVLANTDAGPGCFFVPRWTPDGPRNAARIR